MSTDEPRVEERPGAGKPMDLAGATRADYGRLYVPMSLTLARQLITLILQLSIIVVLARQLGSRGYGEYMVAAMFATLLANFLTLGLPSANTYFLPRGEVSLRTAIGTNLAFWGITTAIGVGASSLLVLALSDTLFPGVPPTLLWIAIGIFPLVLLNALTSSLLQACQDFVAFNLVISVSPLVTLGSIVVLLWVFQSGVAAALSCWGAGQLVATILSLERLVKQPLGSSYRGQKVEYARLSLPYGLKAYASIMMAFMNYRIDFFIVNYFVGPGGVGIYGIATQIAEKLWLLSQATTAVLMPRLAQLYSHGIKRPTLTPLIARWTTYVSIAGAVVIVFTVALLAGPLIGPEYGQIVLPLVLLLPGVVIYNCARTIAIDFAARGRLELNIWASGIALIATLLGDILLIPHFGLLGAAIVSSGTYMITTCAILVFYARLTSMPWWHPLWHWHEDLSYLRGMLASITSALESATMKVR